MSSIIHVNNIKPYEGDTVHFDGNISASGNIVASSLIISSVTESVLFKSGSTRFGNDITDTHTFSGSINVSGSIFLESGATASFGYVSASIVSSSQVIGSSGSFSELSGNSPLTINGEVIFTGPITASGNIKATGDGYFANVGIGTTVPGDASLNVKDGKIILTDTQVAHGITNHIQTDAYGDLGPIHGTRGGLLVNGTSDQESADARSLTLRGLCNDTHTDTVPVVEINAAKRSGTSIQALTAAETVLQVQNHTTVLATVLGNGDITLVGNVTASGNISASGTGSNVFATGSTSLFDAVHMGSLIVNGGFIGNISASGDISTSENLNIEGSASFGTGTVVINGTAGQITASGTISASGNIIGNFFLGDRFQSNDNLVFQHQAGKTNIGTPSIENKFFGSNIELDAPVTASGDISSSGVVAAATMSIGHGHGITNPEHALQVKGNISASAIIFAASMSIGPNNINPEHALQVKGNISASGNIQFKGDVSGSGNVLADGTIYSGDSLQGFIFNRNGANPGSEILGVFTGSGTNFGHGSNVAAGKSVAGVANLRNTSLLAFGDSPYWKNIAYGNSDDDYYSTQHVFHGNITASSAEFVGNISSSGVIVAATMSIGHGHGATNPEHALQVKGNISASAIVFGATGSFGRLEGLSPITVGDDMIATGFVSASYFVEHARTVAAAGSGIGDATAIGTDNAIVFGTTDDAAKGVKLPAVATLEIGTTITVHNTSAATLEVYPTANDRIFPLVDDAPATIPVNTAMIVTAFSADGYVGYFTTVIS